MSQNKSEFPCNICKEKNFHTNYCKSAIKERMDRDNLCFTCAFWQVQAEKENPTVINHHIYTPGKAPKGARFSGMAGRRFDIEYFNGRKITTYDLWHGGAIPEYLWDRIPDTARFINAEAVQVGDITCWNSTPDNTPPYEAP